MSAQRVCSTTDLVPESVLRVELDGPSGPLGVALVRDAAGALHAVSDTCSHQAISLSEGEVEDCTIECWLHGSRFDLRTGRPTSLPAVHAIPVYAVSVDGDDVLVDVTSDIGPAADRAGTTSSPPAPVPSGLRTTDPRTREES